MAAPRCSTPRLPKPGLPGRFDRTPRSDPGRFCFIRSHRPSPCGAGWRPAPPGAAALRQHREKFPGPFRLLSASGGGAAAAEAGEVAADLAARLPNGLAAAQLMALPQPDRNWQEQGREQAPLHRRLNWEHWEWVGAGALRRPWPAAARWRPRSAARKARREWAREGPRYPPAGRPPRSAFPGRIYPLPAARNSGHAGPGGSRASAHGS